MHQVAAVGSGEWGSPGSQSKLQTPNTELQRSSKSQAPRQGASDRFWNLAFGISLEVAVWDLVFRSLTSRPEPIHSLSRHPSPWPPAAQLVVNHKSYSKTLPR